MAQNSFGPFGQESTFSKEDPIELNRWYQMYRKMVLKLPEERKIKRKKRSGNSKY
jgi:hypothetical protein